MSNNKMQIQPVNASFIDMIRNGKKFPPVLSLAIILALAALDTVGCVVLIIGGYIFMKKGRYGLSLALVAVNILIPDMLPVVDEIFGLVITLVPMYQTYQKQLAMATQTPQENQQRTTEMFTNE